MTSQQFRKTKGKIEHLAITWETLLDLPGHRIKHRCVETTDGESSTAVTEAQWQYRDACITWYLPEAVKLSDEDLELTMVHELVHVLLDPIREFVPRAQNLRNELATENVSRALYSCYKRGL